MGWLTWKRGRGRRGGRLDGSSVMLGLLLLKWGGRERERVDREGGDNVLWGKEISVYAVVCVCVCVYVCVCVCVCVCSCFSPLG